MSYRNFTINQNYYDFGYDMYKKDFITIHSGLTVLSGCNGSGKTTLMHQLREDLSEQNIPFISYNDIKNGRNGAMNVALNVNRDLNLLASLATSSEGEQLAQNIGTFAKKIGQTVRKCVLENQKELFIFLDASDSGLSVDRVLELKDFTTMVINDAKRSHVDCYFIMSANEFELCKGECFSLPDMEYKHYNDYESWKNSIMESRDYKRNVSITRKQNGNLDLERDI